MEIQGRTKIHDDSWSSYESAAVKIGEDTVEVKGLEEYRVNGELNVRLPTLLDGFQLFLELGNSKRRRFAIRLGEGVRIVVKVFDSGESSYGRDLAQRRIVRPPHPRLRAG